MTLQEVEMDDESIAVGELAEKEFRANHRAIIKAEVYEMREQDYFTDSFTKVLRDHTSDINVIQHRFAQGQ